MSDPVLTLGNALVSMICSLSDQQDAENLLANITGSPFQFAKQIADITDPETPTAVHAAHVLTSDQLEQLMDQAGNVPSLTFLKLWQLQGVNTRDPNFMTKVVTTNSTLHLQAAYKTEISDPDYDDPLPD